MLDIGFWELMLVAIVTLLVVGPDRLPSTLRRGMLWLRQVRGFVDSARRDIERELRLAELQEQLREEAEQIDQLKQELATLEEDTRADAAPPRKPTAPTPPGAIARDDTETTGDVRPDA